VGNHFQSTDCVFAGLFVSEEWNPCNGFHRSGFEDSALHGNLNVHCLFTIPDLCGWFRLVVFVRESEREVHLEFFFFLCKVLEQILNFDGLVGVVHVVGAEGP